MIIDLQEFKGRYEKFKLYIVEKYCEVYFKQQKKNEKEDLSWSIVFFQCGMMNCGKVQMKF